MAQGPPYPDWNRNTKNYLQMCAGVKKNLTELADLRIGLRLTRLGLAGPAVGLQVLSRSSGRKTGEEVVKS